MADPVSLDIARVRRMLDDDPEPKLWQLAQRSTSLRMRLVLETGKELGSGPMRAYPLLAQGKLEKAVESAGEDGADDARVLRLAAASDGASAQLRDRALALPPDQGIDSSTIWSAAALAARHGKSLEPYRGELADAGGDDAEVLLQFLDAASLRDHIERAEASLAGLSPRERGYAYSAGTITLGDDAPAAWRAAASRLLFASERPYFKTGVN